MSAWLDTIKVLLYYRSVAPYNARIDVALHQHPGPEVGNLFGLKGTGGGGVLARSTPVVKPW